MSEKKPEIPLDEFRKKVSSTITVLYEIPCPDVDCNKCPACFDIPNSQPYVGCMICRLFERFNEVEAT